VAFAQPGGPHPHNPFRLLLDAAGTHPVIRIAAPQCFPPTVWLHPWLTPEVQGIGQRPIGEDGCDRAPLGCPGLGMDDLPIRVHHPCLQPLTAQGEQGPVVDTQAPQVHPPRMVPLGEAAWDSSLYQGALPSVLAGNGAGADRLQCPPSGAIAVPTMQKVLLVECRSQLRAGQWHQGVFPGGKA
jgi:hypothetical protein